LLRFPRIVQIQEVVEINDRTYRRFGVYRNKARYQVERRWKEGCHTSLTTPQVMHRIVALAYVPNPDPITHIHVAHKQDEKCNYLPEHLEWTTPSDNHMGRKARRSSYEQFYDFFLAQKWVQD